MTEFRYNKDDYCTEYFALAATGEPFVFGNIDLKVKLPFTSSKCDSILLSSILVDNVSGSGGFLFVECLDGFRNTTFTNVVGSHTLNNTTPVRLQESISRRIRAVPILVASNAYTNTPAFYQEYNDPLVIAEGIDQSSYTDDLYIRIYNQRLIDNITPGTPPEFSNIFMIFKVRLRKRNTQGTHITN